MICWSFGHWTTKIAALSSSIVRVLIDLFNLRFSQTAILDREANRCIRTDSLWLSCLFGVKWIVCWCMSVYIWTWYYSGTKSFDQTKVFCDIYVVVDSVDLYKQFNIQYSCTKPTYCLKLKMSTFSMIDKHDCT